MPSAPDISTGGIVTKRFLRGSDISGIAKVSAAPPPTDEGALWTVNPGLGCIWQFRYNPSSTSRYKWEFNGGGKLYDVVTASESYNSTSYGNPSTSGPTVTIPRAGEYLFAYGCRFTSTLTTAEILYASPSIAGGTPTDANAVTFAFGADAGGATKGASVAREVILTVGASQTVRLQYRRTTGTFNVEQRWISVLPLRVI